MKKRIFTAIDISGEAREKISAYIENLRRGFKDLRVGWDKPEKLHFTLKFFGDVDENELENLTEAVKITASRISNLEFQISDFDLQIHTTGVFPNLRNPRVLWLGLEDEKDFLKTVNLILENECERRGFEREKRKFKPHLTIARLREPRNSKKLAQTHLENEFEPVEFKARSIVIYESTLLPTGSVYKKIGEFNFSPQ